MSRAEKEAREMIAEAKMQKAVDRAYDRANKTPVAPMPQPAAPMPQPAPQPVPQAAPMPATDQMGSPTGMKKGGKVSASKRADGIAARGHTKGKYL